MVFPNAVVVHANNAQFAPGQKVSYSRVESRMLLWCKAGSGTVTANDRRCELTPGRYLVLPWAHRIAYQASQHDPFLLAGIHVVPRHASGRPIRYDVAHQPDHELAGVGYRRDVPIPALRGVKEGTFQPTGALPQLAEYIVRVFLRGHPPAWQARQLAQQLLHELIRAEDQREVYDHGVPPELERLKQFVLFHRRQPLSLRDLVEFSKLSPATIGRLFRRYLHTTPVSWIQRVKIECASELLRTRRLSVAEVAAQVGIPDPYYFSKCFRKITGQSPRAYRQRQGWL